MLMLGFLYAQVNKYLYKYQLVDTISIWNNILKEKGVGFMLLDNEISSIYNQI